MSAFAVVKEFVNAEEGYAGGHFIKAWNALVKRYEDTDTIDVADLKQTYYDEKMTEDMRPSHFVDKMKKYRKRLTNEMGYKIEDEQFMDILAKLPKGSDDKALGPYQIQRRMIVKDIENATAARSTYDIEDMVRDLD